MSDNPAEYGVFTDEQFLRETARVQRDYRYPDGLKAWALDKLRERYQECNPGQELPKIMEPAP